MINSYHSYNSAILFDALEFVQTIISQFVLISWQKYEWFGNPHSFEKCFFLPKKNAELSRLYRARNKKNDIRNEMCYVFRYLEYYVLILKIFFGVLMVPRRS